MRWYNVQGQTSFKFNKVLTRTKKAILIEMEPGINIWIPHYWIKKLAGSRFTVTDKIATEIKLKVKAEKDAQY